MPQEGKKASAVRAFMHRVGSHPPVTLPHLPKCEAADILLERCAINMRDIAESAMTIFTIVSSDQRMLRLNLIAEEFSELIEAMSSRDEVEALDALADLLYVVIGTAIQFDLPLDAAFYEVHRANMTKHTAREAAVNHTGDKGKGPDYVPPDIGTVLISYRTTP